MESGNGQQLPTKSGIQKDKQSKIADTQSISPKG